MGESQIMRTRSHLGQCKRRRVAKSARLVAPPVQGDYNGHVTPSSNARQEERSRT